MRQGASNYTSWPCGFRQETEQRHWMVPAQPPECTDSKVRRLAEKDVCSDEKPGGPCLYLVYMCPLLQPPLISRVWMGNDEPCGQCVNLHGLSVRGNWCIEQTLYKMTSAEKRIR